MVGVILGLRAGWAYVCQGGSFARDDGQVFLILPRRRPHGLRAHGIGKALGLRFEQVRWDFDPGSVFVHSDLKDLHGSQEP